MQLQLMDRSQTAIRSLLNLYGRFYQDVGQREQIESTIKSGWRGVPLEIQIRTLIALGQCHAVNNQDLRQLLVLLVKRTPWFAIQLYPSGLFA